MDSVFLWKVGLSLLGVWLFYTKVVRLALGLLHYKLQGFEIDYFYPFLGFIKLFRSDLAKYDDYTYSVKRKIMENPQSKVFISNVGWSPVLVPLCPKIVRDFYSKKASLYERNSRVFDVVKIFVPTGMINLEGDMLKKHRTALSPLFNFERFQTSVASLNRIINGRYKKIVSEGNLDKVDILMEAHYLTGEVIVKVFLGEEVQFSEQIIRQSTEAIKLMIRAWRDIPSLIFGSKIVKTRMTKKQRLLWEKSGALRELVQGIIQNLKNNQATDNAKKVPGLVDLLLRYGNKPEDKFSDDEIIDEFIAFMAAGTETTAHLIKMCVYFLLKHPEHQQKIRDEVHKIAPQTEKDAFAEISLDDVAQMKYIDAVIKEALRLNPGGVFTFTVLAAQDHNLADIHVKKGTLVTIPLGVLGYNPDYFKNPQEFRPERWLNEEEVSKLDPFIYIPFSAGSRNCIGQHLARIETKLILAKLLCGFDMKFTNPDYKLRMEPHVAQTPSDVLYVQLNQRRE